MSPQETESHCLGVFEYLLRRHGSAGACHGDGASGFSRPGRHMSPTTEPPTDNPQTGEQLDQRSPHTITKVLGPTTDFPTWASGRGSEKSLGIWLWRPVGYGYRTFTGLGKQTLGGHKQNVVHTRTQQKGAVYPKETERDVHVPRSLQQRGGLTVACCGVSGTD